MSIAPEIIGRRNEWEWDDVDDEASHHYYIIFWLCRIQLWVGGKAWRINSLRSLVRLVIIIAIIIISGGRDGWVDGVKIKKRLISK